MTCKVFQLLHPEVEDNFIVRHARTTHRVNKVTPLSQALHRPGTEECPIDLQNEFGTEAAKMSAPKDIRHGSPSECLIVLDDDLEECRQGTAKKPILISNYVGGV
jgi:hypothetical protein